MAFKDQNGKITIDEVAALSDIKHIKEAEVHFSTAYDLLSQMINMASEFSGKTGESIVEASRNLQKQIKAMMDASDYTTQRIHSIVKKYEQIDADLKKLMEN